MGENKAPLVLGLLRMEGAGQTTPRYCSSGAGRVKSRSVDKIGLPDRLAETDHQFIVWEALACWVRLAAMESAEAPPTCVGRELERRCPGFSGHYPKAWDKGAKAFLLQVQPLLTTFKFKIS